MIQLLWMFDVVLGMTLLWLAWRALGSPDLFRAVVLFIAFGLLMALAWVRLDAVDVALAEAAIGAGLTGALLLAALAKLDSPSRSVIGRQSVGSSRVDIHNLPCIEIKADRQKDDDPEFHG